MTELLPARKKIDAGIDMTPLIDVVFQLLIFLMVSSQFVKPDKQVELPAGHGKTEVIDDQPQKKHLITITSENELILNGEELTLEDFEPTFGKILSTSEIKRLELRGDVEASLGTFITIVETAKSLGIESLSYHKKNREEE